MRDTCVSVWFNLLVSLIWKRPIFLLKIISDKPNLLRMDEMALFSIFGSMGLVVALCEVARYGIPTDNPSNCIMFSCRLVYMGVRGEKAMENMVGGSEL